MTDVFRTPVDCAIVHSSGWTRVGVVEVVTIPLIDSRPFIGQPWITFARLSSDELEEVARREGARLPTMATLKACWDVGLRLKPVQLVGTTGDHAKTALETQAMMGKGFCDIHDRRVWEQLAAARWEGERVVANVGKHWVRPHSPGKGRNGGWFNAAGVPVQPGGPGSEWHESSYVDYSQTSVLERDPMPEAA